jgi:pSer/pThr/pTyr-binding forkhead associated (FHA) protein
MSDPRLDSGHLDFPRREGYRRARQELLDARGWLTIAGSFAQNLVGDSDDWPSLLLPRPGELLPGGRFLLVEQARRVAYPLRVGLNTVGRYPSNDVVLEESWVSRRHCVLLVHARGGCELHDTASRNGTWVNGRRVDRATPLNSGDCIAICNRTLWFVKEEDYRNEFNSEDYPTTDGF